MPATAPVADWGDPNWVGRFWKENGMKYRVIIAQDEDGVFVAEVPALPGCISQGKTRNEAINNIREAIEGYLESLKAHGEPVPPPITEEVVEVIEVVG
jgi:predicted RNase H-like HicB family nuclease